MDDNLKSSFSALFDFSFRRFITIRVVRVMYVLALIGISFATLGLLVSAFESSAGLGVLTLFIGAPIFFILSLLAARVYLELIMVIFRISENISAIAETAASADRRPKTPEA
ncbi:MAG: DUF4282 domain-containing protein [Firmicutes bacterium]|nr:DUF4282 domain-containing protein [Bacillota bacterium]